MEFILFFLTNNFLFKMKFTSEFKTLAALRYRRTRVRRKGRCHEKSMPVHQKQKRHRLSTHHGSMAAASIFI
ncbi:MAG: hypothetical protein WAU24_00575 [Chitinophagaceae bacterium]